MKNLLQTSLIYICLFTLFSCSMSIQKRRYRPGYHVDVVQHFNKSNLTGNDTVSAKTVKGAQEQVQLVSTGTKIHLNSIPAVNKIFHQKQKVVEVAKSNKLEWGKRMVRLNYKFGNGQLKVLKIHQTNSIRGKRTGAWIVGGVSIFLAVVAGLCGPLAGLAGIMIAAFAGGIAFVLAIIAILVRYIGVKKQEDYVPKPPSESFVKISFIFSLIIVGLALIGVLFTFFRWPFGIIGWSIGLAMLVGAIVTFSLGFAAFKVDKTIKTKLTIVFGFIALLFAILALALFFI